MYLFLAMDGLEIVPPEEVAVQLMEDQQRGKCPRRRLARLRGRAAGERAARWCSPR